MPSRHRPLNPTHRPDLGRGWACGALGMAIFSGSLPATRVAVGAFDPLFLTFARASLAGLVAVVLLACLKGRRPRTDELASLGLVATCVVVGFPLLTAMALEHVSAAHSLVYIGLLPMATALFGVLRTGDRPRPAFWACSLSGAALVAGFALGQPGSASLTGDLLMLAAVTVCGLGYAEGARLSRRLQGWRVICWALTLALPLMLPLAVASQPPTLQGIGSAAWWSLGYVSLFSMLIGFIFWYRGLALGGVAAVGQLQLLQPFLGLGLAAWLLNESISVAMLATCAAVVVCVAGAKRFATPAPVPSIPTCQSDEAGINGAAAQRKRRWASR
ncbi:DMT family transporter [Halomonas sp. DN3]|uniref:DMT family transporter n=1 Tax=Halomonas sp. DN3 TaxID=2953657 RepID=UPI00209CC97B|nr:DMT family transporter [Halomonas sp. DN3]USZ50616.1 DMT family transporter [Halomonas sp. DN3]